MLHYFCVHGSNQFSGFVKHEFWSRTALLACQDEPIVRQSLIALSSLHVDLSNGDKPEGPGEETLRRYGKALRALQRHISSVDMNMMSTSTKITRTALVCCILFHCFELSLGNSASAMSHLSNGLGLLYAHHRDETSDDELVRSLRDTLSRLDLQATFFDDGRTPSLDLMSPEARRDRTLDIGPGDSFSGLEDAQRSLVKLQNWQFRFLLANTAYFEQTEKCIPPAVLGEKACLLEHCLEWERRYNTYSLSVVVGDKNIAIRTLQMQYEATLMLLNSRIPPRPEVFGDVPNIAGRSIVQLCESIMCAEGASPAQTVLSSETGPVSVLFMLALKCSDQQVVSKARELLSAYPRRESLYDSRTVSVMLQRLEELKAQRKGEATEEELQSCSNESLEYWCGHLMTSEEDDMGDADIEAMSPKNLTVDTYTSTYSQLVSVLST